MIFMLCIVRIPLAHPHPNNHNINASLSVTVKCYRNLKDYIFYSFHPPFLLAFNQRHK